MDLCVNSAMLCNDLNSLHAAGDESPESTSFHDSPVSNMFQFHHISPLFQR